MVSSSSLRSVPASGPAHAPLSTLLLLGLDVSVVLDHLCAFTSIMLELDPRLPEFSVCFHCRVSEQGLQLEAWDLSPSHAQLIC